jgi:putative ABC transport system substrate-binding protein
MRRRDFIGGLASTAAWPMAVRAQQPDRIRRIGVLLPGEESDPETKTYLSAFIEGLAGLGWTDGRNLRMDIRWAARNVDRLRMFAKELVDLHPDLIAVNSGPVTRAVQQQTRTIPIIFMGVGDPVSGGLLESISRPEGNTTGVTNLFVSMGGKWLEMLKEAVPRIARVAMVFNPEAAGQLQASYMALIEAGAVQFSVAATRMPVRNGTEIERAFEGFAAKSDGGVIVLPPGRAFTDRELIYRLALEHRLPVIYPYRYNSEEGGLMSYGSDSVDLFRRGPFYVDRILRGAKVSDLPVQFPTKFELVINLKTAKAMGLEIPPLFLARADEVIE